MPGGRPSAIDQIVGYRDVEGQQVAVTAFDRIVASLRIGGYLEPSAAAAGINKSSYLEWLRTGARAIARAAAQGLDLDDPALGFTAHELRCIEFSAAVLEAEATWEIGANTTLDRLARGGMTVTSQTVKQERREVLDEANPNAPPIIEYVEIERTIKTETLPPNAQVIMWRLTRRFNERYRTAPVDEQGVTVENATEDLAAELRAYLAGIDDAKPKRKRAPRKPKAIAPPDPAPEPEVLLAPAVVAVSNPEPAPPVEVPVLPPEAPVPAVEPRDPTVGRARPIVPPGARGRGRR